MKVYLKGYYGYRNIGDEVLLLGVIDYLQRKYSISHVTIEADDPERLSQRIQKHSDLVHCSLSFVNRNRSWGKRIIEAMRSLLGLYPMLILGGGEVINAHLSWPRNGRHYLFQYPGIICGNQHYMILGGVTTKYQYCGWHIRTLCHHADEIVLRDQVSYEYIATISPQNIILYHDRAYDVLDKIDIPSKRDQASDYVILNIHPDILRRYVSLPSKLTHRIQKNSSKNMYFVPGDIRQDKISYDHLIVHYPHIKRRDRSTEDLPTILSFFAKAHDTAASRLHLLLLFQSVGHQPTAFSYHPKIQKILDLS